MAQEFELSFPCWACIRADNFPSAVDAASAQFLSVSRSGEELLVLWQSESGARNYLLSSGIPPLLVRFENPELLAASVEKSSPASVMIILSAETCVRYQKRVLIDMLRKAPEPQAASSRISLNAKESRQVKRNGDGITLPLPCYAALHNVNEELVSQGLSAEDAVWVTATLNSEECFAIWASDYDAKAFIGRLSSKPLIVRISDGASLLGYLERVPFTRLAVNPNFDAGTPYQFEIASVIQRLRGQ